MHQNSTAETALVHHSDLDKLIHLRDVNGSSEAGQEMEIQALVRTLRPQVSLDSDDGRSFLQTRLLSKSLTSAQLASFQHQSNSLIS
jgi:hypothetical protein